MNYIVRAFSRDSELFADFIKRRRSALGLSQEKLATLVTKNSAFHCGQAYISDIENDAYDTISKSWVTEERIAALVKLLGLDDVSLA